MRLVTDVFLVYHRHFTVFNIYVYKYIDYLYNSFVIFYFYPVDIIKFIRIDIILIHWRRYT